MKLEQAMANEYSRMNEEEPVVEEQDDRDLLIDAMKSFIMALLKHQGIDYKPLEKRSEMIPSPS